jgi:prolyl-tRNA editing enzyme YbaK/EbsC (Cys-tRNA(Pro) deacylase)
MAGTLDWMPALDHPELVAPSVVAALTPEVEVAAIDPDLADTAAFCAAYGIGLDISANCVVLAAKYADGPQLAACIVLATTRADVNGLARRTLGARKASFAPMDAAVAESGMAYGGITPLGLPPSWPVLVDKAVTAHERVVVGSGVRHSKLMVPSALLADLPHATVLDGLGLPPRG